MIRVNPRSLLLLALVFPLPALTMGCPKKEPPPPVEDSAPPPPPSAPTVTELAPLIPDDAGDDAGVDAGPKKYTGPAVNPNQAKIAACCNAMRAQAKQMTGSPEAFQLNAMAAQCDIFAKQVGPLGTAPEFAQLRQVLKSVKLPSACSF
jgi:hypothetical protein